MVKFYNVFFSPILRNAKITKKLAYIGVMTALSIVCNMFFEFKFFDIQFSLTITISCIIGVLIGSLYGFVACFVGDLVGYLVNSWGQLYMPWVGLSTAFFALLAGMIINGINLKVKGALFIKIAIFMITSFIVCTIGINSTGFYFYNQSMGFSTAVINYVNQHFGTGVGYFGYLCYRLFFKGQIFNSLANYALIFALLPIIFYNKTMRKLWGNEDGNTQS